MRRQEQRTPGRNVVAGSRTVHDATPVDSRGRLPGVTSNTRIAGTKPRRALVMHKLGTIPEDEEVELPVFREGES